MKVKIHNKLNRAFSLLEISVVIIIIGILIVGISKGIDLFNDAKLLSAQNLTKTSPLKRIPNVTLWYETTLNESFITDENNDGSDITRWNDISNNSQKNHGYAGQKTDPNGISYNLAPTSTAGNTKGPIYIKDGINGLPTLQFRNTPTGEYRYIVSDINSRNQGNEDLTLIVVAKYISGTGHIVNRQITYKGLPYTVDGSYAPDGTPTGAPVFGLDINNSNIEINCRYNDYTSCASTEVYDSGYDITTKPTIFTLQRAYGQYVKLFYNGKVTSTNANKNDYTKLLTIQPLKIGRHVNWESSNAVIQNLNLYISEVILITGTISGSERASIEDYLGKKYGIAVSH